MKVRFRRTFFAPDISGNTSKKYVGRNGRVLARGHRLRKGVHEVPDEWLLKLPSDAQVLEGPYELEEDEREFAPAKGGPTLANAPPDNNPTVEEAAALSLAQITEKVETDRKEAIRVQRVANMATARDAKALKQKEKDADA